MAKNKDKADVAAATDAPSDVEDQAQEQAGQQVRVRVDERDMSVSYANAFRTNGTAEEVMLDFGGHRTEPCFRVDE